MSNVLTLTTRWPYLSIDWGRLWNPQKDEQRAPAGSGNSAGNRAAITDERALSIGAVFRCIRILAETGSGLPLRAYRGTMTGDREPLAPTHWLSRLIEQPNETMTGDEWVEAMIGQMAGWGNGYSQIVRQSQGRPVELWPYTVDKMRVFRNEDRTLRYEYPDAKGHPVPMGSDRVLHFRAFSLDAFMGVSPLGMARNTLGMAVAAENYAGRFFANGGRPAGVMTSEKLLTDKQREQVRKEYGPMADGSSDKSFWLMEASLKYQPITVSPEDMQMLQTRSFEIKEIARFFGVPLFLLMETEGQTSWGTGLEQNNSAFLLYALRPYISRIQSVINSRIIPPEDRGKLFVEFDETPLMWADTTAQGAFLSTLSNNGIMARNEARRRLKLPAIPGEGPNQLTVQTALTDINKLGQQPRPTTDPGLQKQLEELAERGQQATQLLQMALARKTDPVPPPSNVINLPRPKIARFVHERDGSGRIAYSVPVYEDAP